MASRQNIARRRTSWIELDNWKNKIGGDGHDAYVAELEKKARDAKQELDASNIEAAKDELQAANDGYNATPKGNVEDLRRHRFLSCVYLGSRVNLGVGNWQWVQK